MDNYNYISDEEDNDVPFSRSFHADMAYPQMDENRAESGSQPVGHHPKILLMGLRRSGKSSLHRVVFQKMSPNETLFLESTPVLEIKDVFSNDFIHFQVWDYPGIDSSASSIDFESALSNCGSLIFVIDSQDDYNEALSLLQDTVEKVHMIAPKVPVEVFLHKMDGLPDDTRSDVQRDIQQQTLEDLADAGIDDVALTFHLTSIYDHTVFEAFSKVIQKMLPQLPTLENLLNILNSNCLIDKSFLFDVVSKVYIATDCSPVDMQTYQLASDMIDVIVDVSYIYGLGDSNTASALAGGVGEEEGFKQSAAVVRLTTGLVLYLRQVARSLALVSIVRENIIEQFNGAIDFNVSCFQKALSQLFTAPHK
eukprot:GCRY01002821.1.p1 GENE.GCRY01002821.1~~GCRY01002821.1.p1  ORF type:complete len:366 (-),score=101.36 GCRY01002821.1:272-1369(-)